MDDVEADLTEGEILAWQAGAAHAKAMRLSAEEALYDVERSAARSRNRIRTVAELLAAGGDVIAGPADMSGPKCRPVCPLLATCYLPEPDYTCLQAGYADAS
jgi:hypothetical protein